MDISRVAIFGGTFDPVHLGHLHIAKTAREKLDLDLVIFIPCKQSPHKERATLANERERCAMLSLALDDYPWAAVSTIEIDQPPPSFSWLTAEALKDVFPDARLYWLMGTDQWKVIDQWARSDHLASMVDFIVFQRGDEPLPHPEYQAHFITGEHPAEASQIRAADCQGIVHHQWLDPKVEQFIQANGLYQCGA